MAKAGPSSAPTRVEVGSPAPSFSLQDQQQRTHRLEDYRGRWVVLYFYPKDDTSGCTQQACSLRDSHDELQRRGLVVLGVSPDNEASHAKFANKHQLPFPLLADHGSAVATAYGVWGQKSMYGRKYMGILRTTYLIDPEGRVAHRWDKVKVAEHAAEVLAQFEALAPDASGRAGERSKK